MEKGLLAGQRGVCLICWLGVMAGYVGGGGGVGGGRLGERVCALLFCRGFQPMQ